MRKNRLGKPSARNPQDYKFRLPSEDRPQPKTDKLGRPTKMVAAYWPSRKGGFRMQLLRRYWHVNMPYLLDVWPHVLDWSSSVETIAYEADGNKGEFTASFRVRETTGAYALYLYESGTPENCTAEKEAAREARHERFASLFAERRDRLRFMSRAMLEGHPHLEAAKEIFYHRYWALPEDMPREVAFMVSREKSPRWATCSTASAAATRHGAVSSP